MSEEIPIEFYKTNNNKIVKYVRYEELELKDKEIERLKDVYEKNLQLVDKLYLKDKEIERLNKELEELKHIMYIIRDDNGLNHLWCKDIILKWLKGDGSNE